MQKVLRQQILTRNQGLKRAKDRSIRKSRADASEYRAADIHRLRGNAANIRAERKHRREDWFMGALAPNREYGNNVGSYGTVEPENSQAPTVPPEKRVKFVNFAYGDRVVMIDGREKGKIGEVRKVDRETQTVTCDALNMVDIKIPPWAQNRAGAAGLKIQQMPSPIPFSSVRLVVPMSDSADPSTPSREYIVRAMHGGEPFEERDHGSPIPRHTRYISGLGLPIPWPNAPPADFKMEDMDTPRRMVEEITFVPDLGVMPMPGDAVNEVVNKYARARRRHDADWVREKVQEDVKNSWVKQRRVLTPQAEFWERENQKREKEREEREREGLSDDTIALIKEAQGLSLKGRGETSKEQKIAA
ncbi:MAG: hypothetical protein Q9227_006584 [Pyrenula ochraceoflavens]